MVYRPLPYWLPIDSWLQGTRAKSLEWIVIIVEKKVGALEGVS